MGFSCPDSGEYMSTTEDCDECEERDCRHHPRFKDTAEGKRLERLRTSEFAAEIMKRMSTMFALPEKEMAHKLEAFFEYCQQRCDQAMEVLLRNAVESCVTRYFDAKLKGELDGLYKQAVEAEMILISGKESDTLTSIRQQATAKMQAYFNGLENGRSRRGGDSLSAAINNVLDQKVSAAVEEIKKESIEKFNKEAMKKMMAGMAAAIQNDKRLLAMMCD